MNDTPALGGTVVDPPPGPGPGPVRRMRRSRTNRVGAGVASGLGEYFRVDPVLFRVLFATAAFFGGAGVLAYLLAWAVLPDDGTEEAPVDGWIAGLRRHRIPPWVVIVGAGLLLWGLTFTWWSPVPLLPVVVVVVVLAIVFGRRDWQRFRTVPLATAPTGPGAGSGGSGAGSTVVLTKSLGEPHPVDGPPRLADAPGWLREGAAWLDDARTAHRERRRRALPVKLATLTTLGATLIGLGIADSVTGIAFQVYFWVSLAIVAAGLLVGMALRRTPWTVASLLPLLAAGAVAFAGSPMQLGDGIGQKQWRPTDAPASHYAVAFGQGVLDLTRLPAQTERRVVDVRIGAGQLKILSRSDQNLTVDVEVHAGQVKVVRPHSFDQGHSGVGFNRTIDPPRTATGAAIVVHVHLADGQVQIGEVS